MPQHKILILTLGSQGDVQPCVAVGYGWCRSDFWWGGWRRAEGPPYEGGAPISGGAVWRRAEGPPYGGGIGAGSSLVASAWALPLNCAPLTSASVQPRSRSTPVMYQVCASMRSGPRTRSWKRLGSR